MGYIIIFLIICTVITWIAATIRDRQFNKQLKPEMDRLRAAKIDPRTICFSQAQLCMIQQRYQERGYLTQDEINVLAANKLKGKDYEGLQACDMKELTLVGLAATFSNLTDPSTGQPIGFERALQDIKHSAAQAEQKRKDEAFAKELEVASEAVANWSHANPNDPLAQQVLASLLELAQAQGTMQDDLQLRRAADVVINAYGQLVKEGRLPTEPVPKKPKDPNKRNNLLGGEEPVW